MKTGIELIAEERHGRSAGQILEKRINSKMKQTFKHSFDRIYFYNRWMMKRWEKPSDWCIIGIYTRWAGYEDYCYGINIFGLECRVWFKRTIK